MDPYQIFVLATSVLQGVLETLEKKPGDLPTETVEQLDDAKAAVAMLQKFHGTPVTKAQLESLRG